MDNEVMQGNVTPTKKGANDETQPRLPTKCRMGQRRSTAWASDEVLHEVVTKHCMRG